MWLGVSSSTASWGSSVRSCCLWSGCMHTGLPPRLSSCRAGKCMSVPKACALLMRLCFTLSLRRGWCGVELEGEGVWAMGGADGGAGVLEERRAWRPCRLVRPLYDRLRWVRQGRPCRGGRAPVRRLLDRLRVVREGRPAGGRATTSVCACMCVGAWVCAFECVCEGACMCIFLCVLCVILCACDCVFVQTCALRCVGTGAHLYIHRCKHTLIYM